MGLPSLTRYAWLSVATAILTMALKYWAYLLTNSVGLLSDAAESSVNLCAALVALYLLGVAAQPADAEHPFGHGKAEYFASGFEGILIVMTAGGIIWAALDRLHHPVPLKQIDIGAAVSAGAGIINLIVALMLLRAGHRYKSITLEADGRHLLSDVWTTGAVLIALIAVSITGWLIVDPLIALVAALQIAWSGSSLVTRSLSGLLDSAIPGEEEGAITIVFQKYREQGIEFHDLRTRVAGAQRLVTVHVLVPGYFSVQEAHDLVERIENDIHQVIQHAMIITHLEPLEDVASFNHERIDTHKKILLFQKETKKHAYRKVGKILFFLGGVGSILLPENMATVAIAVSLIGQGVNLFFRIEYVDRSSILNRDCTFK